ncbi:F-box/RNI-like superfamily protein [Actinidia rufa]|uniref:F-box/RNI-like superfamily protein n=1 Tax=Actinidia rufa TaxID=165716 RepID=A0A7J0G9M5_9ERIC|nr:F-box/RNI-like superfamily protein [Actinidia rufa]
MSDCENEKRLKKCDPFQGEDKISNLPEAVLCHILSFLSTKAAVRTSILGTKWKDLWAFMPILEFDFKSMYHPNRMYSDSKEKLNKFMNFVERGLILRDGLNIRKFTISCFEICDFPYIYAWISNVVTCNIQELDIRLSLHPYAQLPWSLLTCRTLVALKLSGRFVLNVPSSIHLPSLKILHLRSLIYLDDVSIEKLFSSCPILEDLDVVRSNWDNVWSFTVSVPSLRRLSLRFDPVGLEFINSHWHKLTVNTPNLEYLKLHDHISEAYVFSNLSHLVEADIDVQRPRMSDVDSSTFAKRVHDLLPRISNVKFLSLSTYTLQVLGYYHGYNIPKFHNLVHLKLGVDRYHAWRLLPNLLVKSPSLEVLLFEEGLVHVENPYDYYPEFSSMQLEVPACVVVHLKAIEIYKLVGMKDELKLIQFFVKNATVLEKLTIRCHCLNVVWNIREKLLTFRNELRKSSWGSSSCQLKFII